VNGLSVVPSRPKEPDNPFGGHPAPSAACRTPRRTHRACQRSGLARRGAAGERRGVVVPTMARADGPPRTRGSLRSSPDGWCHRASERRRLGGRVVRGRERTGLRSGDCTRTNAGPQPLRDAAENGTAIVRTKRIDWDKNQTESVRLLDRERRGLAHAVRRRGRMPHAARDPLPLPGGRSRPRYASAAPYSSAATITTPR
jgi:hypothetical protein